MQGSRLDQARLLGADWVVVSLLAIIVAAAALRFVGIDFGRDLFLARPDENGVLATLKDRSLPLLLVVYGGGYFYPLRAFLELWGTLGWGTSLGDQITRDFHSVFVAARSWSALLSIMTVWLVFKVGTRLSGRQTGLLAAVLLTCSTLAVREAHFAKADTACAFATTLALLVLTRHFSTATRRAAAIGLVTGLALSTKAAVGILPAVLLALLGTRNNGRGAGIARSLFLAGAVSAVVILALNPIWITSPGPAWLSVRSILIFVGEQPLFPDPPASFSYHATVSLRFGCGAALALLTVPAIALGLVRPGAGRLIALSVLGHSMTLLTSRHPFARYFLPCLPALAVLVAHLLVVSLERLQLRSDIRRSALVLCTMVLIAEPLGRSVELVRLLRRDDTRTLAGDWIQAHVPGDARIVTWGAPPPRRLEKRSDHAPMRSLLDFGQPPIRKGTVFRSLRPSRWQAMNITHLVQSSYPLPFSNDPLPATVGPLRRLAIFDPFDGPLRDPVFEPLDAFYLPLARFSGVRRPGPKVEIFAVTPDITPRSP